MRHRHQAIVAAFEVAGIPCAIECRDGVLAGLVSPAYADFAADATPRLSLRVEIVPPPPDEVVRAWQGPFARITGGAGALAIEGPGFRGAFDERSGRGWIVQPPDPAPFETFLTAICAGRLLRTGGFLLHAAAILSGEDAFVFFGPSGSGKTTVAELIGKGVISDEIAVIRRDGAGFRVSALPWRGRRLSAPLGGLFRLRKAQEIAFAPLSPSQAVRHLLPSVFLPRAEAWEAGRFLEIAQDLVKRAPCYEMRFTPDGALWDAILSAAFHPHPTLSHTTPKGCPVPGRGR